MGASTSTPPPPAPVAPDAEAPTPAATAQGCVDPIGDADALPEEVPLVDATVPPAVDGELAAEVIRRELQVARAEALATEAQVRLAAELVDELEGRLADVQRDLSRLDVANEEAVNRIQVAREKFEQRVADAVVRGNKTSLEMLLGSANAGEAETRTALIGSVAEADDAAVREYLAAKEAVDEGIFEVVDEAATIRRELRSARTSLAEALAAKAETRFELAVFSQGSEIVIRGFVFPVAEPYSFIDSWGFPRMIGTEYAHGHEGTDIMAPFGTPLFAVERGIVTRVGTATLGGIKLWVKGESGTYYYYAHLQSYADGIEEGALVDAGDVVGYVGDTGNAKGGAPHLHFEIHPGGGAAVNPYPLLRVVSELSGHRG